MSLLTTTEAPSPSMRRWFGLSLCLLLLLIGYALRGLHPVVLGSAIVCSAFLTVIYYFVPATQLPVIRTWKYITFPLAWTIGHALLLIVFYVVLCPIALLLRWRGHDPLALRPQAGKSTWIDRPRRDSATHYFKQY